jgi:hypothetical protein
MGQAILHVKRGVAQYVREMRHMQLLRLCYYCAKHNSVMNG